MAANSGPSAMPSAVRGSTNAREVVTAIAAAIKRKELSAGDLAEMRRLRPEDPSARVFQRLMTGCVAPNWPLAPDGESRDQDERCWGIVMAGMAEMAHDPSQRLGRVLAETGFSELRFVRLLRAQGNALGDIVRGMARFVAAKGRAADWGAAAALVVCGGAEAEAVRRKLARDYYGSGVER